MLKRRPFSYAADLLCLTSWALYAVNRLVLLPLLPSAFLRNHFDDLLFVPAVLPLVLWVQRRLKLRDNDLAPQASEIVLHVVVWSVVAEWVVPHFAHHGTGDWLDVLSYSAGAVVSWVVWNRPVNGFDWLAPLYGVSERLVAGRALQRARTHFIDRLEHASRVVSVGEGHGRFAQALLRRWPAVELTCVEASEGMVAAAKRRLGVEASRVTWVVGDAREVVLEGQFDAVVTCFFLDCFSATELDQVIDRLAQSTKVWLNVDFAVPEAAGFARLRAQVIHAVMYVFFRLTTRLSARALTAPDAALKRNGFSLNAREELEWGLLRADVWLK